MGNSHTNESSAYGPSTSIFLTPSDKGEELRRKKGQHSPNMKPQNLEKHKYYCQYEEDYELQTDRKKLDYMFVNCEKTQTQHDRQCTYKRNTEERSRNHRCSGKAMSITYSDSVVLVIHHTMRMRHITLSSPTCLALPYFFHYFWGEKLLKIKNVF